MNKTITIIFVVGLLFVIVGVGVSVAIATKDINNAYIPALTAALVWVTAYYAIMTGRLFEATNRGVEIAGQQSQIAKQQAEIMLNEQYNAVAPLVSLKAGKHWREDIAEIWVSWLNVGKGPAINFRCWIEDSEHPEFRQNTINREVIPATLTEDYAGEGIQIQIPEYELGVGFIRAQYESIFGKTYESCLMFPINIAPQFEWGEAKEVIRL